MEGSQPVLAQNFGCQIRCRRCFFFFSLVLWVADMLWIWVQIQLWFSPSEVFSVQFCFEDVIFNVPVGCFETGPILELEGFVLFLQALLYLWNNPGFGVGIFLNFSGWNGKICA